jgi:torulene dioxygenase
MTVVMDGVKGDSYLMVLDAKTMKEFGRGNVGSVVGFGFHGTHVGAKSTERL